MVKEKNSVDKAPNSRLVLCVELLKSFTKDEMHQSLQMPFN